MKRKKAQKRTAKSRKKHATENRVVKPLEPLVKQTKQYASVDISLVPIKSPRRNVKPPKKYADEAFIYYNNTGADEFGIDPAFLCECALDVSDPSVSEDKLNSSESTETASENGENIADISNLCETVLITSDPADSSTEINKSTDDGRNEIAVESEDGFIDLSQMCQAELITSDPADPQIEINRLGKAGNSEQEFILGLSDNEIDFASSMRHNEKEVCQKKTVEKHEFSLLQKTENKENTTVPKRKAQKRRKTRIFTGRRKRKKKNIKEKVQVQENENNIPTYSTAINVDHPRLADEMVCSESTPSNEILATKPGDDHLRRCEENVSSENVLGKEVPVVESSADKCRPDGENISLENKLDKDTPVEKPNTGLSSLNEENVSLENILDKDAPVEKPNADQSSLNEENFSLENILDKDAPVEKPNVDQSSLNEENVSLENILDKDTPVEKPNADQSSLNEENVSLENILDKDTPVEKPNADQSSLNEENVSLENILSNQALVEKPNAEQSRPDKENISLDNILKEEVPNGTNAMNNADCASLDKEKVCPENILDKEVHVLILDTEKEENSTTNSDEGKLCEVDEKPKQLMADEKNLEECSVPDTDSGCDVDMEQCCDEEEHLNDGVPDEEEDPAVNQVPYFNETRIVKVSLHRLEDQAFFSVWKEDNQVSKFQLLDLSRLQPANNDDTGQKVSAEVSLTVLKSKKSKKYKRRFGTKRKPKHVRCTNCNKKFPNEFVMKKHLGSHTCVVTVKCRICHAKFKSLERLLEHKESNCDTERVFACDVCGRSYAYKQHLEKHQNPVCRSFTSKSCEICNQKFDSRISLKTHMVVHGPNTYLCEICGALFESKMKFKYHKETHLQLPCKQCGREFKSTRSLQNHIKTHSSNKSKFTCAECGKTFLELDNLKNHLAVHGMITSLEKFECNICQKVFSKDRNLKRHLKIHVDKTECVCHKCNIPFNTHQDLKEHITFCCGNLGIKIKSETNLSIKEEKPYECHSCGKCFSKSYHLDRHSVVHREQSPSEVCDICGKKFKTNFHLNQHKLMVSCNKSSTNYFCKECENEYTNFAGLKMHFIEAHNIKTTVKCDKCGKEFENNKKLRWHSITHSEGYWTSCKHCGKVITKRSLKNHIFHVHKSLSGSGNVASVVKVEPLNEVDAQQPNLSNDSGVLPTYSRHSENPKPKLTLNSHSEKNLLPCRFCGKILGSRCSLKRHVLSVHKSSHPTESSSSFSAPKVEPPIINIKVEEEDTYVVQNENYTTPSSEISMKVEEEESYNVQNEKYTVPSSEILMKVEEEKTYVVQNENYTAPSSEILVKDERPRLNDNTGQKSLSCGICGKILAHSRSLRRHMISVHKVPMNSTTSHVVPKTEGLFNVDGRSQLSLVNKTVSLPERSCNEIKAIEGQNSGSTVLNNQICSMGEQKFSMHLTSMQVSPGQNSQSYGLFDSNVLSQTEQQVPETPSSIGCLSQNDYQSSEISNTSILMSQMINAQNYKMYLPNTSFLNSQCQNSETKSTKISTKHENTGTHKIITQPPQSQQNHYPLLEDTSLLTPMAYLSHEVPTANSIHSLPMPDFLTSNLPESVKIPPSNQYPNSEAIIDINSTSLLENKHLDMIDTFICTPPPVQAADLHSDTLFTIPMEEPLTPQYGSAHKLNASIHTAPPISYNYFIAPGSSDISETLSQDSNLTSQTSIPSSYQSLEMPDVNFKIIQQRGPAVTSTNRYVLHQYIKPKPAVTTSIAYQSPEVTNTFIVMQPKLVTESPRTSNTIVSIKTPSLNQYTKKVEFLEISRKPNIICTMCKSLFYSKEDLNKHLIVHGLEVTSTSYRCTTCDQSYDLKYKYRAEQHVRIHTGEKPFSCNKCSERFRSTSLLNKHSLTHTKPAVPITCSVCQMSLSSTYSLRRHLKKVHRIDPPPTNPFPEPIKKEPSAKPFHENDLGDFITRGTSPIQSEPVEPAPNFQQPYTSREISDFRGGEELTSSHSYSYSFDESNGNHSDIALDLSDLRDDFVPDAMETVLKLENW